MTVLKILHSLILFILVGGFLYSLLFRKKARAPGFPEGISLVFLLGMGGLPLCLFLLGFAGWITSALFNQKGFVVYLSHEVITLVSLLCGAGWVFLNLKTFRIFLRGDIRRFFRGFRFLYLKARRMKNLERVLVFIVLLLITLQFMYALRLPLIGFDSRAHWGFKTKILHCEETFFGESFFEPERIHPQVKHPLLLPLMELVVTKSLGRYDDRLMKIPLAVIFACMLGIFYSECRRRYLRWVSLCLTILLGAIPRINTVADGGMTSGYADASMMIFLLASLIFIVRALQKSGRFRMAAASLFAAFAMYTKDDATGFTVAMVVALIISILIQKREERKVSFYDLMTFIVMTGILVIPGRVFSSMLSAGKGEYFQALLNPERVSENLSRLDFILFSYKMEFVYNLPNWGFLWLILILSCMNNFRRFKSPPILFTGLTILFYLGALTVIFIVLPWNLSQFFAGSLSRLIMPLAPASVYLIAMLWKKRVRSSLSRVSREIQEDEIASS